MALRALDFSRTLGLLKSSAEGAESKLIKAVPLFFAVHCQNSVLFNTMQQHWTDSQYY